MRNSGFFLAWRKVWKHPAFHNVIESAIWLYMVSNASHSNRELRFIDNKIFDSNLIENLKKTDLSLMMKKASIAAALNCKKIGCNPPSKVDIETFKKIKFN